MSLGKWYAELMKQGRSIIPKGVNATYNQEFSYYSPPSQTANKSDGKGR